MMGLDGQRATLIAGRSVDFSLLLMIAGRMFVRDRFRRRWWYPGGWRWLTAGGKYLPDEYPDWGRAWRWN